MNVFVLCTGRNGSMTFARACSHLTNYTAGHETRGGRLGDDRLAYPDNHIEADNRLAWFLGRLDQRFGDSAFYVHLTRDPEQVARSFSKKWTAYRGIISAYDRGIVERGQREYEVCVDYVRTVTENIECFLKDKSQTMRLDLEEAPERFPKFAQRIGAAGDVEAAASEFSAKHNATAAPDQTVERLRRLAKLKRAFLGLPTYLREC